MSRSHRIWKTSSCDFDVYPFLRNIDLDDSDRERDRQGMGSG